MDIAHVQNAEDFATDQVDNDDTNAISDGFLSENSDGVKVQSVLDLHIEIGLRYIGLSLNSNFKENGYDPQSALRPKEHRDFVGPDSYRCLVRGIAENVTLNINGYDKGHLFVEGDLGNFKTYSMLGCWNVTGNGLSAFWHLQAYIL